MAKSEFLQLAHVYDDDKHRVNNWLASTKLDGMRAWWDGGVSRGKLARTVPWANVEKDARYVEEVVATGLWSRLGKVIRAPGWWLDRLPELSLDGELYLGPKRFQELVSRSKDHYGDWRGIQFRVLDSPPLSEVLKERVIDIRIGGLTYKKELKGCLEWIGERRTVKTGTPFVNVYEWLLKQGIENETVVIHPQEPLPAVTEALRKRLQERFEEALAEGNEGLILRHRIQGWRAERSWYCLKYKPEQDAEGVVVGYTWGRETALGSKLLGKMGSLLVRYQGKVFGLSGFTEEEREMNESLEGFVHPGEVASEGYFNPNFPRGSTVTFLYRELTRDGVPKEARYLRVRREG